IFVRSEKAATRVMTSITKFIEKKLGLKVNVEKSRISRPSQTKFLGFGFYFDPNNKQFQPRPHKTSVQKFQRKLRQLTKRNWSISLDVRIMKLKQVIVGWVNYFKIAHMKSVLQAIDAKLRSRVRVIIWKQWKNNKKRINTLVEEARGLIYSRRGYRFIGLSKVVQRSLIKHTLKAKENSLCPILLSKSPHCNINRRIRNRTYGSVRGEES